MSDHHEANLRAAIPSPASSERGRPREFDTDDVTRAAGQGFWEQGYHATSTEMLCKSTGLFRASLYSAFGNKHGLLIAAFDQYAEGAVARLKERLERGKSPHDALRQTREATRRCLRPSKLF